jgi:GTPase
LRQLGIEPGQGVRLIEVWNKVDRLDEAARQQLQNLAERQPAERRPVIGSATTGEGMDALIVAIEARLSESRTVIELVLDPADGAGLSWLHRHTEVMAKSVDADGRMALTVRADPANAERLRAKFGLGRSMPAARAGEAGRREEDQ